MKTSWTGSFCHRNITVSKQKGFTIVELLVVIAILAILGTAVYAFFNNISVKSTAQRTVSTTQQQARSVVDMMARDIRMLGLDPLSTGNAGVWPNGEVEGTSSLGQKPFNQNSMAFSADLNYDGYVDDPFERIAYYIDANGNLIMETLVLDTGSTNVTQQQLVMLTGLLAGDLVFRYFDSTGSEIINPVTAASNNANSLFAVEVTLTVRASSLGGNINRTYSTMVRLRNKN